MLLIAIYILSKIMIFAYKFPKPTNILHGKKDSLDVIKLNILRRNYPGLSRWVYKTKARLGRVKIVNKKMVGGEGKGKKEEDRRRKRREQERRYFKHPCWRERFNWNKKITCMQLP